MEEEGGVGRGGGEVERGEGRRERARTEESTQSTIMMGMPMNWTNAINCPETKQEQQQKKSWPGARGRSSPPEPCSATQGGAACRNCKCAGSGTPSRTCNPRQICCI